MCPGQQGKDVPTHHHLSPGLPGTYGAPESLVRHAELGRQNGPIRPSVVLQRHGRPVVSQHVDAGALRVGFPQQSAHLQPETMTRVLPRERIGSQSAVDGVSETSSPTARQVLDTSVPTLSVSDATTSFDGSPNVPDPTCHRSRLDSSRVTPLGSKQQEAKLREIRDASSEMCAQLQSERDAMRGLVDSSEAHLKASEAQFAAEVHAQREEIQRLSALLEANQGQARELERVLTLNAELDRELSELRAADELKNTREGESARALQSVREIASVQVSCGASLEKRECQLPKWSDQRLSMASVERLFSAVSSDDCSCLEQALKEEEHTAEVVLSAQDPQGRNLLHVALMHGAKAAAGILLDAHQKWAKRRMYEYKLEGEVLGRHIERFVNGQDAVGRTPLKLLCEVDGPDPELCISVLAAGGDPTQHDEVGCTPFLEAAKIGNVALMKLLLQFSRGAVLGDADFCDRKAIHLAAMGGRRECVELLVAAKACVDEVDVDGCNAAQFAQRAGHLDIAKLLNPEGGHDENEEVMFAEGLAGNLSVASEGSDDCDGFTTRL